MLLLKENVYLFCILPPDKIFVIHLNVFFVSLACCVNFAKGGSKIFSRGADFDHL